MDVVVANAGVEIIDRPMVDLTEEDFERVVNINIRGNFLHPSGGLSVARWWPHHRRWPTT
ncbi:hypothetical protein [Agromyces albus]|uniref:hypothetical protein n=1 Tax=Agromyces albus TaxID=205332 RepID=UPI00358E1742